MKGYVNAQSDGSWALSNSIGVNTHILAIGSRSDAVDDHFNGFISNVQIYNTSFDTGQIQTLTQKA